MGHGAARRRVVDHLGARGLLLDAYTGHGGVVAASVRDGQRARVCRGAAPALAAGDVSASAERLAEFRQRTTAERAPSTLLETRSRR
jgi:hypothetical protein